jgi:hypothetical protein
MISKMNFGPVPKAMPGVAHVEVMVPNLQSAGGET